MTALPSRPVASCSRALATLASHCCALVMFVSGCRTSNPAFELPAPQQEAPDSAALSTSEQSAGTGAGTSGPPSLETTPDRSSINSATSSRASDELSLEPIPSATENSPSSTHSSTIPPASKAESCDQPEFACFDMKLVGSDDDDNGRILDRANRAILLDIGDAKCNSTNTRAAPFDHQCVLDGPTRIESIQSIELPSSGGIGLEVQSKNPGCANGSRCLFGRIQSVITLEYDGSGTLRCTLPKIAANPLVALLPTPQQPFVAACWQDGTHAFLQVRGGKRVQADHKSGIPLNSTKLILGGGNEVGGAGSHYTGAFGLMRIWSDTDSLAAYMSTGE